MLALFVLALRKLLLNMNAGKCPGNQVGILFGVGCYTCTVAYNRMSVSDVFIHEGK